MGSCRIKIFCTHFISVRTWYNWSRNRAPGVPWELSKFSLARAKALLIPEDFLSTPQPKQCEGGLQVKKFGMPLSASKEPRPNKTLLCPALPPGYPPFGSRAPWGNVAETFFRLILRDCARRQHSSTFNTPNQPLANIHLSPKAQLKLPAEPFHNFGTSKSVARVS